ncbi:hypothetical protein H6503_05445 [Candidatus Woesearchaeota archaeon]|nr:hypothetical protein [Candidatus Woesearchaeota archaeon]
MNLSRLMIISFFLLFLIGCSTEEISETKSCQYDLDCAYANDEGSECINVQYAPVGVFIYDQPACVCNDGICELEKCEGEDCFLG